MKPLTPRNAAPGLGSSQKVANELATADVKYSAELFGSRRELLIKHAGCVYRLRITQHNKLILTK